MAMRLLGFMVVLVDRGRWDGMAELALAMMKVVPEDQPFNWLPQGLGNHNQESHRPSTSNSRKLKRKIKIISKWFQMPELALTIQLMRKWQLVNETNRPK
ncbi:hypothetical protein CK203_113299 [Vitis vinifera]|uniref:Uncharacterized protein n=1 Tax=Vitis vinifera TaxID=29760 RepID=A0A438EDC2_VITVI|nr:hypothetical protein CK203_113299 [Vitis vinifera]